MSKEAQSPRIRTRPLSLNTHSHRVDHNSSKLPRVRDTPQQILAQIQPVQSTPTSSADSSVTSNGLQHGAQTNNNMKLKTSSFDINFTGSQSTTQTPFSPTSQNKKEPFRTRLLNSFTSSAASPNNKPSKSSSSRRTLSYPTPSIATTPTKIFETTPKIVASERKARNVPVSNSKNGLINQAAKEKPSTMLSQGSYVSQTKDWIADQSHIDGTQSSSISQVQQPALENTPSRSANTPLRGVRASRKMEPGSHDSTLMALEGHNPQIQSLDEQISDDSDLFLKVAEEEDMDQMKNTPAVSRSNSRKSRIGVRNSVPAQSPSRASMYLRRGSEKEENTPSRFTEEAESSGQLMEYKPSLRSGSTTSSYNTSDRRNRYSMTTTQSNPTTPRFISNQETSPPESPLPYTGRRPSIQDRQTTYRQSNLSSSYSVPRATTYHSSPLVPRPTETNETPETQRATDGTESSVSTTAPSTVWDELDDLKSRIHKLELTGKLPTTSGAAVSRATHERPPTATTTETTMSTSPKRGRGNSTSPTEGPAGTAKVEVHPLLRAALAKSKPLLDPEVYKNLEATATDALAIASMMGHSGQAGPISSSQSSVGGAHAVTSDRQVRRKVDSLCRSLTELCLALSERRSDENEPTITQNLAPNSSNRDTEVLQSIEPISPRQPSSNELMKVKSSPRTFSRLEARRSSLLASTVLPTFKYPPSDTGAPPTPSLAGGRRTSLFLRNRRAETEDPQETEEARFRAPSRANTELGRYLGREGASRASSSEQVPRTPISSSSLGLRRSYTANLTANSVPQSPVASPSRKYYERTPEREMGSIVVNSSVGGRRYLERTPERDTPTLATRLAEERGQRKVSAGTYTFASRNRAGSVSTRRMSEQSGVHQ